MKKRIDEDLALAEKLDIDPGSNSIRARYQDGRETVFRDVEIYWPSLVRELYKAGHMSKQKAVKELRKVGLKLVPDDDEPKPTPHG